MKQCNEVITVFNAKHNIAADHDNYSRTIISGVSWFHRIETSVDVSGLNAAGMVIIRIPTDADFSGKTYVNPREYASSEDVSGSFTLQDGDVIVKGSVMEDLRPADLHKQHYEAVTVLGVTDNRQFPNAPHWRVTGR